MKKKISISIDNKLLEQVKAKAKELHIPVSTCIALVLNGTIKLGGKTNGK